MLASLSLNLSLVVFQLGNLHYCLCYSVKFIITLNEGLGLQLLGQNLDFSQVLRINCKNLNLGPLAWDSWLPVRGSGGPLVVSLGAPWLSVRGPLVVG